MSHHISMLSESYHGTRLMAIVSTLVLESQRISKQGQLLLCNREIDSVLVIQRASLFPFREAFKSFSVECHCFSIWLFMEVASSRKGTAFF